MLLIQGVTTESFNLLGGQWQFRNGNFVTLFTILVVLYLNFCHGNSIEDISLNKKKVQKSVDTWKGECIRAKLLYLVLCAFNLTLIAKTRC